MPITGVGYTALVIGMVGLIEDIDYMIPSHFQNEGDLIYLIGQSKPEIGGSEFLKEHYGLITGDCPSIDLNLEKKTLQIVLRAIRNRWISSAHDLSDGGFAIALAEACIMNEDEFIGAVVDLNENNMLPEYLLFSESQSRFLISLNPSNKEKLENLFSQSSIDISYIGKVGGNSLRINNWIDVPLETLQRIYYQTIPEAMNL